MAINKVVYGNQTLVDLTEDTVTAEDVLNGATFHDRAGVSRSGTASYPVTDVEVNGESVVHDTVAEIDIPVSGDVSTTDSFESYTGGRVKSAKIQLNPIQDLHGYDSPWVGGAGKNYLEIPDIDIEHIKTVKDVDGNNIGIKFIGQTQSASNVCVLKRGLKLPAGTYFVKNNLIAGSAVESKPLLVVEIPSQSTKMITPNSSATFTLSEETTLNNIYINYGDSAGKNTDYTSQPYILSDSETDKSFSPYSNICPIIGHTEVDLYNVGKNRFDKDTISSGYYLNTDGGLNASSASDVSDYIPCDSTMRLSFDYSSLVSTNSRTVCFYDSNKDCIVSASIGYPPSNKAFNIVPPSGAKYVRITLDKNVFDVQVEVDTTTTSYEPYKGKLYQVQIGSTVYGGYVDLVSGKLVIDRKSLDLGSQSWVAASTNTTGKYRMLATLSSDYAKAVGAEQISNAVCDIFKTISAGQTYRLDDGVSVSGSQIIIYDERYDASSSASDFTTAMNGHQLVYELATPITIQLTPQQISALIGENNFSAPLEQQEIIEIIARNIAEFNEVIDDENVSEEFTYSSEKIEETYVNKDSCTQIKSAETAFNTVNGGLLEECNIDLEPVQDLHGYDYPWVGGAGKNLLPMTVDGIKSANTTGTWSGNAYSINGVTFTILTDSDNNVIGIKATGSPSGGYNSSQLVIHYSYVANTQLTLNGSPLNGGGSSYRIYAGLFYDNGSGVDVSYSESQTINIILVVYLGYSIPSEGLMFYPMLRLSSVTDATFAPYTNICSIWGHTEVDLYNVGKNLWNGKYINTNFVEGDTWSSTSNSYNRAGNTAMPCISGKTYSCSLNGVAVRIRYVFLDSNKNRIGSLQEAYTTSVAPDNAKYLQWRILDICTEEPKGTQLELGSEVTSYEPYNGKSVTVQLGQTVYGGTVDLVSGVMVATHEIVDLGSLTWVAQETDTTNVYRMRAPLIGQTPTPNNVVFNATCSCYKAVKANDTYSKVVGISGHDAGNYVYVYDENYNTSTSESAFTTAMNGQKLVYPLATPFTIQLTPQQIEALVGQNNLSTPLDGQSIDSVKYREVFAFDDVEKVVSLRVPISMLGTDESGRTTASRAYTTGEFFYKDGKMYKVLTNIASGATFTVGTNISETTLFAELTALA